MILLLHVFMRLVVTAMVKRYSWPPLSIAFALLAIEYIFLCGNARVLQAGQSGSGHIPSLRVRTCIAVFSPSEHLSLRKIASQYPSDPADTQLGLVYAAHEHA